MSIEGDPYIAEHPGKALRAASRALKRPTADLARLLGMSRQSLYDIMGGRQQLTAATALRVGKLTGTRPEAWLKLQQTYDLQVARRAIKQSLDQIPTLIEHW